MQTEVKVFMAIMTIWFVACGTGGAFIIYGVGRFAGVW